MKNLIVGQDSLIKNVSRILDIFITSACEIKPHFILTGPSGSGKTLTIRNLAEKYKMSFLEINAAQITKEGASGNSLSKALTPLAHIGNNPAIVFVDEFDKLFISGNSNDMKSFEFSTDVQNEFLKMLESRTTSVFTDYGKYINISIENVLFVFAGSFNNESDIDLNKLRELGVKTEFLGRVGLIFNTEPLSLEYLYEILESSDLLEKYLELFENVKRADVIKSIKSFLKENYEYNTIGARYINNLINQYFINDGKINSYRESVKRISFTKKLTFDTPVEKKSSKVSME